MQALASRPLKTRPIRSRLCLGVKINRHLRLQPSIHGRLVEISLPLRKIANADAFSTQSISPPAVVAPKRKPVSSPHAGLEPSPSKDPAASTLSTTEGNLGPATAERVVPSLSSKDFEHASSLVTPVDIGDVQDLICQLLCIRAELKELQNNDELMKQWSQRPQDQTVELRAQLKNASTRSADLVQADHRNDRTRSQVVELRVDATKKMVKNSAMETGVRQKIRESSAEARYMIRKELIAIIKILIELED